ncbi:hypothetical protein [Sphingomonas sp.]|uniref:hypothetical protein n=1 Tax=Sphingomonas sp. TaxID=28214 RepID=UPI00307ED1F3
MSIYNRSSISPNTRATAEQINAEFAKIAAALEGVMAAVNSLAIGAGLPSYDWYAYADSVDGTANFTTGAPGNRAYIGIAYNKLTPVESNNPEDYAWTRLRGNDGTDGTVLRLEYAVEEGGPWHGEFVTGDRYWRQSLDGGETFTSAARLSATTLAELDAAAATRLAGIEANADVTSQITGASQIVIQCDHTGTVLAGQFDQSWAYRLNRNGTDVTTDATWSRTVVNGTVTCAIGAGTGILTVTALSNEATVRLTALRGTTTRTYEVKLSKSLAAPPNIGGGTGGAGTSASDTSLTSFTASSTAMVTVSDELTVTVASDGIVDLSLITDFTVGDYGFEYSAWHIFTAFQWYNGTAWVDVATEQQSGVPSTRYPDIETGQFQNWRGGTVHNAQKSGLTPGGSEKFRLRARSEAGHGLPIYFSSSIFTADGT